MNKKNISLFTNVLGQVFDNKIHWVLPGSDTFYFNNPILSTENDLVVDLTYRDLK